MLRSLGYEVSSSASSSSTADRVARLCELLHSEVECELCGRKFVDQESLKRHHATLHIGKQISSILK